MELGLPEVGIGEEGHPLLVPRVAVLLDVVGVVALGLHHCGMGRCARWVISQRSHHDVCERAYAPTPFAVDRLCTAGTWESAPAHDRQAHLLQSSRCSTPSPAEAEPHREKNGYAAGLAMRHETQEGLQAKRP